MNPNAATANGSPGTSGSGGAGGPAPAGSLVVPGAGGGGGGFGEAEEVLLVTTPIWAPPVVAVDRRLMGRPGPCSRKAITLATAK